MPLQLRRGTEAELAAITPVEGELIYIKPDNDNPSPRLAIGDGTSVGGTLVSGYSDPEAKDAVAEAFAGGTHTAISFSYNTGAKTISASVNLGDYTGTLKATAFKGTLVADDSTILVDGVSGRIVGDVYSDIYTDSIAAGPGGTVVVSSLIDFNEKVEVHHDVEFFSIDPLVENSLKLTSAHSVDNSTPAQFSRLSFRRYRNNLASPAAVVLDDRIGDIDFRAYISGDPETSLYTSASIRSVVAATPVLNTSVAGKLEFLTAGVDGILSKAMEIDQNQTLRVFTRSDQANVIQAYSNHANASDTSNILLARSRGSFGSETANTSGDPVFDLLYAGHDGSAYLGNVRLRAVVSGTVSTGVVPGRFEIGTRNNTGTLANRLTVDSSVAVFSVMPQLPSYADETAATTAVGTPANGMMFYDTSTGKIKARAGGVWVALH